MPFYKYSEKTFGEAPSGFSAYAASLFELDGPTPQGIYGVIGHGALLRVAAYRLGRGFRIADP
jgi:hypothetical protein